MATLMHWIVGIGVMQSIVGQRERDFLQSANFILKMVTTKKCDLTRFLLIPKI